MLFNSLEFFVFFAIVISIYPFLSLKRQNLLLLIASYIFYGSWNWRFLPLLFISAVVDYTIGLQIGRSSNPRARRNWMWTSVAFNFCVLAYFKYFNFFIQTTAEALRGAGLDVHPHVLAIVLPAGISFFLFQSMSYAIDLYRGETELIEHLPDYLLYTGFFPNMLAGPIERPTHLSSQLRAPRVMTPERTWSGLMLMLWGLFKKVAVADNLAGYVNAVYGNAGHHNGTTLLVATYIFAFQIYCDFSGYSDMAIGMARILGIDLITNFRTPYFARNIQEFWRRWHISLSTWFRDYVYYPLGGNRGTLWMWVRNTMIVFLVSGLWHGANWTFVIWGGLHGLYLLFYRFVAPRFAPVAQAAPKLWMRFSQLLTFNAVCLAWVFFRARSVTESAGILGRIATAHGPVFWDPSLVNGLLCLALMLVTEAAIEPNAPDHALARRPAWAKAAFGVVLAVSLLLFGSKTGGQFIYFQF